MFKVSATVNYDGPFSENEFEAECEIEGKSLDEIWTSIKELWPTVTSVVLVFTNPEAIKVEG